MAIIRKNFYYKKRIPAYSNTHQCWADLRLPWPQQKGVLDSVHLDPLTVTLYGARIIVIAIKFKCGHSGRLEPRITDVLVQRGNLDSDTNGEEMPRESIM